MESLWNGASMKRDGQDDRPRADDADWDKVLANYVDTVAGELDRVYAGDEDLAIPLSGHDSTSAAEHRGRCGKNSAGYTRSISIAMPCPTPIHMVHRAKRPCRRRSS